LHELTKDLLVMRGHLLYTPSSLTQRCTSFVDKAPQH
jgi:hypothetical protein